MDLSEEFFHVPSDAEFWSESHYFDFVGDDLQGHARLGFYPNRNSANVFAFLVQDETVYSIRDDEISLERVHGLDVREADYRFTVTPMRGGDAWALDIEGTFHRGEDLDDVLAGEGSPVDVSLGLETTYRHEPFLYSGGHDFPAGENEDRYEVATDVTGTVSIDGRERSVDTVGERDHSWGVREWTDAEWLWISGAFDDGTAYNHLTFWLPDFPDQRYVNGFWYDGASVEPITDATVTASPAFGRDTARAWMTDGDAPQIDIELEWDGGSTALDVEPFATTPVDWVDDDSGHRAVLNRSPASQRRDGTVDGRGFLENMTQLPASD